MGLDTAFDMNEKHNTLPVPGDNSDADIGLG